jgi:hypothetical protein
MKIDSHNLLSISLKIMQYIYFFHENLEMNNKMNEK